MTSALSRELAARAKPAYATCGHESPLAVGGPARDGFRCSQASPSVGIMSKPRLNPSDVNLPDWRWVLSSLRTRFETGDFATGATLVAGIAELADELNHHPDVDLRYPYVEVVTSSHDVGGVTQRDVALARRISELAEGLGIAAKSGVVQALEIALDTPDAAGLRPFWAAVLALPEGGEELLPAGKLPGMWFQDTVSDAPDRMRFHLDITVAPEEAQSRIVAALKAGGRLVDTSHQPSWTILEDPDGNKVCVSTSLGRG